MATIANENVTYSKENKEGGDTLDSWPFTQGNHGSIFCTHWKDMKFYPWFLPQPFPCHMSTMPDHYGNCPGSPPPHLNPALPLTLPSILPHPFLPGSTLDFSTHLYPDFCPSEQTYPPTPALTLLSPNFCFSPGL